MTDVYGNSQRSTVPKHTENLANRVFLCIGHVDGRWAGGEQHHDDVIDKERRECIYTRFFIRFL